MIIIRICQLGLKRLTIIYFVFYTGYISVIDFKDQKNDCSIKLLQHFIFIYLKAFIFQSGKLLEVQQNFFKLRNIYMYLKKILKYTYSINQTKVKDQMTRNSSRDQMYISVFPIKSFGHFDARENVQYYFGLGITPFMFQLVDFCLPSGKTLEQAQISILSLLTTVDVPKSLKKQIPSTDCIQELEVLQGVSDIEQSY